MTTSPNVGGCWFCHDETDDECDHKIFSTEWDAYYHLRCCVIAAAEGDAEAILILNMEWNLGMVPTFEEAARREGAEEFRKRGENE